MKYTSCHYCRAENHPDDHRCRRCGRRVESSSAARAEMPVMMGALAPALDIDESAGAGVAADLPIPAPAPGPRIVPPPLQDTPRSEPVIQASLFGPQEVFRSGPPATDRPPAVHAQPASRPRRDPSLQQNLDFEASIPDGTRTHRSFIDTTLYSDAPVALHAHRVMAALVDTALAGVGLALFLGVFHLAGNEVELDRVSLPLYGAVLGLILVFYRLLFCLANADTPGLRWSGLRILNFDGHLPTPEQRLARLGGGVVSVIASGLGLLWALFDEERLTWHDHMSKTFPTPVQQMTRRQLADPLA